MAAFLLAGCARTLVPHTAYIPLTRDQGQAEIRISTGTNASELQAGYQVTNKLVVHTALLSKGRLSTAKGFRSADLGLGYYYESPNGLWRLGGHAGLATGGGSSGSTGACFECTGTGSATEYRVRYTYGYVQPTVILVEDNRSWGFGLRVGRAYYHRFERMRADTLGGPVQTTSFAGRQITFIQPTFQYGYQVSRWFALSGVLGLQGFVETPQIGNDMSLFVGQVSAHIVLNKRGTEKP
ncbi:MAG TPA: hypothetical protein VF629_20490 [Hymenobacter sp.]|uniref:hypothetical protein n=1 Tax=Hymenobacter sp. TaxID=1898978 RepID=UPI002ED781C6